MIIQLTKSTPSKPGALKCIRSDGTYTWQPSTPYFAFHDLIHYAVETALGYSEAFYGLVAAGKGLDEFGTKQGKKDSYTCEEAWAESIVGLLQWPGAGGGPDLTEEEFFQQLQDVLANQKCCAPPLTVEQLREIKQLMRELHDQWRDIAPGDKLALIFPFAREV